MRLKALGMKSKEVSLGPAIPVEVGTEGDPMEMTGGIRPQAIRGSMRSALVRLSVA